jgi:hypothetical protein
MSLQLELQGLYIFDKMRILIDVNLSIFINKALESDSIINCIII